VTPTTVELTIWNRARDYDCPDCGAEAGKYCLLPNHSAAAPRKKPHDERASLAWRQMMAEGVR
jgi:hypothetical protein